MNRVSLISKTLLLVSFITLGLAALAAEPNPVAAPAGPEVGPYWIHNATTRIEMHTTAVRNHWRMEYSRWNPGSKKWEQFYLNGRLLANLTSPDVSRQYREKWGVYYPFEKAMPTNVQTQLVNRAATMTFRVQQEDLWIDMRITLLGDTPLAIFEATGQSRDDLRPHWMHQLTHPMFFAVSDDPADPQHVRAYAARDYRESHLLLRSQRYCIAYKTDETYIYGYLWPTKDRQTRIIQFPRGINASFLDAPFVLYGDFNTGEKNDEAMSRLGEQLYQQLQMWISSNAKAPEVQH